MVWLDVPSEAGRTLDVRRLSPARFHLRLDLAQRAGRPVQIELNVGCEQFGKADVAQLSVVGVAQIDEAKRLVLLDVRAAVTHIALGNPEIKVANEVVEMDHGLVALPIGVTRLRHGLDVFGQAAQQVLKVQALLTLEHLFKDGGLRRPHVGAQEGVDAGAHLDSP